MAMKIKENAVKLLLMSNLVSVEYVRRQVCACAVRYYSLCGCMSFTLIVPKDITLATRVG